MPKRSRWSWYRGVVLATSSVLSGGASTVHAFDSDSVVPVTGMDAKDRACQPNFLVVESPTGPRFGPYIYADLHAKVSYDPRGRAIVSWEASTDAVALEYFDNLGQSACLRELEVTTELSDTTKAPGCSPIVESDPVTVSETTPLTEEHPFSAGDYQGWYRWWITSSGTNLDVIYFGYDSGGRPAVPDVNTSSVEVPFRMTDGSAGMCNRTISTVKLHAEGWYRNNLDRWVRLACKNFYWEVHSTFVADAPFWGPQYNSEPNVEEDCL